MRELKSVLIIKELSSCFTREPAAMCTLGIPQREEANGKEKVEIREKES